jgi:hypothetical protein
MQKSAKHRESDPGERTAPQDKRTQLSNRLSREEEAPPNEGAKENRVPTYIIQGIVDHTAKLPFKAIDRSVNGVNHQNRPF